MRIIKHRLMDIRRDLEEAKALKAEWALLGPGPLGPGVYGIGDLSSYLRYRISPDGVIYRPQLFGFGLGITETTSFLRLVDKIPNNQELIISEHDTYMSCKEVENHIIPKLDEKKTLDILHGIIYSYNEMNMASHIATYNLDEFPDFKEKYKSLKADQGVVPLIVDDVYYMLLNKKILSYKIKENVYITIYDSPELAYFYASFEVSGDSITVIRVLKAYSKS